MTKSKWGGARPKQREDDQRGGYRPNAKRPRIYSPRFRHGETLIMEREEIGGEVYPPQLVQVIGVSENEIEIQPLGSNEIIVIRRELPDED